MLQEKAKGELCGLLKNYREEKLPNREKCGLKWLWRRMGFRPTGKTLLLLDSSCFIRSPPRGYSLDGYGPQKGKRQEGGGSKKKKIPQGISNLGGGFHGQKDVRKCVVVVSFAKGHHGLKAGGLARAWKNAASEGKNQDREELAPSEMLVLQELSCEMRKIRKEGKYRKGGIQPGEQDVQGAQYLKKVFSASPAKKTRPRLSSETHEPRKARGAPVRGKGTESTERKRSWLTAVVLRHVAATRYRREERGEERRESLLWRSGGPPPSLPKRGLLASRSRAALGALRGGEGLQGHGLGGGKGEKKKR